MRIDSIDVYRLAMPLIEPFRTAYGDACVVETLVVRMASGCVDGWGEATPWASPLYSGEWAAGAFQLIRDWLAPRLVGRNFREGRCVQDALASFKGNPFAKAALDTAWWDLHASIENQPLWKIVGGQSPRVEVGADFGVQDTVDQLLERVDRAVAEGYKRVKLKFRPSWDLPIVREVRRAFPNLCFHVDCNAAYTLRDFRVFESLDELGLAMIEQPLQHDDVLDHAELQRRIHTPICLDESINSLERARQAIDIGACRWINIKPGRVGGITPALAILDLARRSGVPCWIGGMLESGIGSAHCLALATTANIDYPSDIFPAGRFYTQDAAWPEIQLSGPSQITAFEAPGIGCRPHSGPFERQVVGHCRLEGNCS